jgi:hypothetical protein
MCRHFEDCYFFHSHDNCLKLQRYYCIHALMEHLGIEETAA